MQVGVLGPLRVQSAGGRTVDVGGARLRALLCRLALSANTVVTVLQKGYTIAERTLRPALVMVAKGK